MKAVMLSNQMISRAEALRKARRNVQLTFLLPVVLLLQSKLKIAVFNPTKLQIK